LPATRRTARAAWPIDAQRHVTKLAGRVVTPAQQLAIHHDADANAVRHAHKHRIGRRDYVATRGPQLGQRARLTGILDVHGDAQRGGERIAQADVAPAERRCVQHATECRIDHAGHDDAHAFARADPFVVDENLLDAAREFLRQHADVFVGLKAADDAELFPHQVSDEDVSARGANVDADDAALAGVDVEKSRAAATADGFTEGAFEDERLVEQLADEETGNTAAHVHQAGEIGAGDWLMSANQVERNLPVDFAAGTAPRHFEIVGIDLSHRNCSLLGLI